MQPKSTKKHKNRQTGCIRNDWKLKGSMRCMFHCKRGICFTPQKFMQSSDIFAFVSVSGLVLLEFFFGTVGCGKQLLLWSVNTNKRRRKTETYDEMVDRRIFIVTDLLCKRGVIEPSGARQTKKRWMIDGVRKSQVRNKR